MSDNPIDAEGKGTNDSASSVAPECMNEKIDNIEEEEDSINVHSANIGSDKGTNDREDDREYDLDFPSFPKKTTINESHVSPTGSPRLDAQGDKGTFKQILSGIQNKGNKVNFRFIEPMQNLENDIDVELPVESIREVNDRYSNTLYGYFVGKRLAYPAVKSYVTNVWKKFGLDKIMMNSKGFFFFKFNSEERLKGVLESGPWIIRSCPIILNKWSPDIPLTKEELDKVPVWVKIHDIPLAGFTDIGLSMIASKIGNPMSLDSYTSTMCKEAWGRPNFARALIEISSAKELKETIKMAIPNVDSTSKAICDLNVEYEWQPPRCSKCAIFGHKDTQCPKNVIVIDQPRTTANDGFEEVKKKNAFKGEQNKKQNGYMVGKQKRALVYRPIKKTVETQAHTHESNSGNKKDNVMDPGTSGVALKNPFEVLNELDDGYVRQENPPVVSKPLEYEESDLEINKDETSQFMANTTKGFATWNIRGLNLHPKQKGITDVVYDNDLCLCGILETHVDITKLTSICSNVFPNWMWVSNQAMCSGGTRIILGWNPNIVHVMVLNMTHQVIHCFINSLAGSVQLYVSIIYADNYYITRRALWTDLKMYKSFVGNHPWVLMGDFNVALDPEDYSVGSSRVTIAMKDFRDCVEELNMSDINHSGFDYVLLKGWRRVIVGHKMFQVVKKLRWLKKPLHKLMWQKGNLHTRVVKLKEELDEAQMALDRCPFSSDLREDASCLLRAYNDAILDEERFLKQKSKVEWLRVGDNNSSYFHKVVNGKKHRCRISAIVDDQGVTVEDADIPNLREQGYAAGCSGWNRSRSSYGDGLVWLLSETENSWFKLD
ncbi:uncharacterized protein [Rutidosis leptorrhynchoides]|uniref:uncharacterized protein n=1 Tax=Rutidosis leptorrhynchoides TaxID=125765 RepID=UPI003A99C1E4